MEDLSATLLRLANLWLDGSFPNLPPPLPGEIPIPELDGAVHLVYAAPASGAHLWLERNAAHAIGARHKAVLLDSRLLTMSDTYSMLDAAAELVGADGVILMGEPDKPSWASSLKRFRDTHRLRQTITVIVVLRGVGERSKVLGTLAGRRGPSTTETLMLPRRFREFLEFRDRETSAAVEAAASIADEVTELARRLQPHTPRLRELWQQWCADGALPGTLTGERTRLHGAQSAVDSIGNQVEADALIALDSIASDPAIPLSRLAENVHRPARWISLLDERAAEEIVWFSVTRPRTVRAGRQRFLVDPSYAPTLARDERSSVAGVVRSLWRMSLRESPERILEPSIELHPIAGRDAFQIGRKLIDIFIGPRIDGRSIRPLRAARGEGYRPIQASIAGAFSTRFGVPVIPSWIVAIAADYGERLLDTAGTGGD